MKLTKHDLEITQTGDFDSIQGKIGEKDMGLAISMVSKNLYSNPIGSFIREITSNAVDANVDANVDSPVLINIYKEDKTTYIEIQDKGVGMSPDTFRNIYMSWFNSDKRDTNAKIGGWGLGSKSPLAYQDSFEIITRFNGIEYSYVLANELPRPTATLIFEEPTEETNGTTIKIEIKDGDEYKVNQECISQLAYFNNVYVKDEIYYYDNEFRIYEAEHYKLRNKDFPYSRDMHICLGQVAYPIDFNILKIERVLLPVALKFEVGELEVTLSREEINYTEKVKQRLLDKIQIVQDEILKKYEDQLQISDFNEYLNVVSNRNKPDLVIEDVSINMTGFKANISFTPLDGLRIKKKNIEDLFAMYELTKFRKGKLDDTSINRITAFSYIKNNSTYSYERLYLVKDRLNFYDTTYLEQGIIVKRKKLERRVLNRMADMLGLIDNASEVNQTIILKEGAIGQIHRLIKYIDEYMNSRCVAYEGVCPEWWKEEYREKQRVQNEEKKERITYYNVRNNRYNCTISELLEKDIVFYADKKETRREKEAYNMIYSAGTKRFLLKSKFIIINPTTINKLKKYDNVHDIENIFKVRSFRHIFFRLKYSWLYQQNIAPFKHIFIYSQYYSDLNNSLRTFYSGKIVFSYSKEDYGRSYELNLYLHFKEQIDNLKSDRPIKYLDDYNEIIEMLDKVEYLKYMKEPPHNIVSKIIREGKALKFLPQYYKDEEVHPINNLKFTK